MVALAGSPEGATRLGFNAPTAYDYDAVRVPFGMARMVPVNVAGLKMKIPAADVPATIEVSTTQTGIVLLIRRYAKSLGEARPESGRVTAEKAATCSIPAPGYVECDVDLVVPILDAFADFPFVAIGIAWSSKNEGPLLYIGAWQSDPAQSATPIATALVAGMR